MKTNFSFILTAYAQGISEKYATFNPLPQKELFCPTFTCDLVQLFLYILNDLIKIVPIISVVFIIIGGFKMTMAAGNEERYADAKRTIVWAILGTVVTLLSFSIIAIVQNFIQADI